MKEIKRSTKIQMFKAAACILVAVVLVVNTVLLYANNEGDNADPSSSVTQIEPTETPQEEVISDSTEEPTDPPAADVPEALPESSDSLPDAETGTESPVPLEGTENGLDETPDIAPSEMPTAEADTSPAATASISPTADPSVSPSITPSASPTATPSATPEVTASISKTSSGIKGAGLDEIAVSFDTETLDKKDTFDIILSTDAEDISVSDTYKVSKNGNKYTIKGLQKNAKSLSAKDFSGEAFDLYAEGTGVTFTYDADKVEEDSTTANITITVNKKNETKDKKETEKPKTEFTYEDSRVVIQATAPEEANLPQDAELKADYLVPGSAAYNKAAAAFDAQLGDELGASQENVKVDYILYDIYFLSESEGRRIEPEAGNVKIEMTFLTPAKAQTEGEVLKSEVVHLKDSGEAEIVTDYVNMDGNGAVTSMGFTQDSFSTGGVAISVETNKGTVPTEDEADAVPELGTGTIALTEVATVTADLKTSSQTTVASRDEKLSLRLDFEMDNTKKDVIIANPIMTYQLPKELAGFPAGGPYTLRDGGTKVGTYIISEDNVLTIQLTNAEWVNTNSNYKGFINFNVEFNESYVEKEEEIHIEFEGSADKFDFTFEEAGISSNKTAYLNEKEGWIEFSLDVKPNKTMDIKVTDILGGDVEDIDWSSFKLIDSITWQSTDIPEADVVKNSNGFDYTIKNAKKGVNYTIKYKVKLDNDAYAEGKISNSAEWSWKGNSNSEKTKTDQVEVQLQKKWISKSYASHKTGDGYSFDWTIVVNDQGVKGSVAGKTITDQLTTEEQEYSSDITITGVNGWSAVVEKPTGNKFEYTFPANGTTDANGNEFNEEDTFTITYQTITTSDKNPNNNYEIGNNAEFKDGDTTLDSGSAGGWHPVSDGTTEKKEAYISKNLVGIDVNNETFKWVINVDIIESITNVSITDKPLAPWLSPGIQYLHEVDMKSIVIKKQDGTILKKDIDYTVDEGPNDGCIIHFEKLEESICIELETKFDSRQINQDGGTIEYSNIAGLKWQGENEWSYKEDEATAGYAYKKEYNIKKESKGYDAASKTIAWSMMINSNAADSYLENTFYVLKDTLPENTTFVNGSLEVWRYNPTAEGGIAWQEKVNIADTVGWNIVNGVLTINIGDSVDTNMPDKKKGGYRGYCYEISYKTKLNDDYYLDADGNLKEGEFTLVNLADLQDTAGSTLGKAKAEQTIESEYFKKSGTQEGESNFIKYTIDVNPDALDLLPNEEYLDLEDILPANLNLNVSEGVKVEGTNDYTVSYDSASRKLTVHVPDGLHCVVTYEAELIAEKGWHSVENKVYLRQNKSIYSTDSKSYQRFDTNSGMSGTPGKVTIKKVDADNLNEKLEGVKFELYRVPYDGDQISLANAKKVDEGYTGANGELVLPQETGLSIDADHLYYVIETKALNGYDPDDTPHYLVLKGDSWYKFTNAMNSHPSIKYATISKDTGLTWTITNKKNNDVFADLYVQKTFEGGDFPTGGFEFELRPVNNAPMPEDAKNGIATVKVDNTDKQSFGGIKYTDDGDYFYTIHEVIPPGAELIEGSSDKVLDEIIYDGTVYDAKVTVGNGTATVSYKKNTETEYNGKMASFINRKEEQKGSITIKKEVIGEGAPADAEFHFTLKDSTGNYVKKGETWEHTIKAGGSITFTELEYGTYTVTETDGNENGEAVSPSADFPYTVNEVTQTVTVGRDSKNPEALITNTYYAPTGSWTPTAEKVFDQGKATYNPEFEFTISGYGVENGTATVNGSGSIVFDTIKYTGLGAVSQHEYEIKEVPVAGDFIVYDPAIYKVTVNVIVDPNNANKLKADVIKVTKQVGEEVEEISNNEVKFTNTYEATGDLELTAQKNVDGESADGEDEKFTFELYKLESKDDTAEGKTPVTTENIDGTITFKLENEFDQKDIGQTFWYLIKEQSMNVETGYVPNTQSFRVSVLVEVDPEDNTKLIARPTYHDGEAIFNNTTYEPDSVPVTAKKMLENGSIDEYRKRFNFNLYQITLNDDETETKTLKQTVSNGEKENSAAGAIEFAPLNYTRADIGKTYTYEISEEGAENYFACDKKTVRFTVAVTYDAVNKKVVATPNYGENGTITFTNTYNPMAVSTTLAVNKRTEVPDGINANLAEMEFNFVVKDSANNEVARGTSGANGAISFGQINFTKGGRYDYTIEEVKSPELEGIITYDPQVIKAVVVVPDNHDGTLGTPAVKYYGMDENGNEGELTQPAFVNKYNPKAAEIQFSGTKKLLGRDWISGDEFTFGLWEGTTANGDPKTATATEANHSFRFEELTFDKTGTYEYTVKEMPHEGATTNVVDGITYYTYNGITYDPQEYHVTVTVSDDGSGQLKADFTGIAEKDQFNFQNTYDASGSFQLAVFKTVNGQKPEEDEKFTFQLYEKSGETVTPVGGPIESAAFDNAKDIVLFDEITYNEKGTHTYVIEETSTIDGYTNDQTVYTAVVTVTDKDHNGTFVVTCQYYAGESMMGGAESGYAVVTVNNKRPSDGEALIEARKDLNGGDLTKNTFTFTLSSTDDERLASRGATLEQTTDEQGRVSFGPLKYTRVDLKGAREQTYTYTITEQNMGEEYIGYDPQDTRTVRVRVYLDGNAIKTDVHYNSVSGDLYANDGNAAVFHNTYNGKGFFEIEGTKTLTGGTQARDFTFDLYKKDTNATDGELIRSVTINVKPGEPAATKFKFENVSIDKIGGSTYVVKEHIPEGAVYNAESQTAVYEGVTYSTKEYKVIVHMDSDGTGGYVQNAELTQYVDGPVAFTNKYKTTNTSIDIYGKKVLTGRTQEGTNGVKDKEFKFGLYYENGDLVVQDGLVNSVKNDANGSFSFHINYTEAGTHNYVVKEIPQGVLDEDGKLNNIHYDEIAVGDGYPVVVEVTDDNKGGLKAEITSAIGNTEQNPVTVTNNYEDALDVTLSATKTVNSAVPGNDERDRFEFMLSGDGIETQIVRNGTDRDLSAGSVIFAPIPYTQEDIGPHVYTVREVQGRPAGQETADTQKAEIYEYSDRIYTVIVDVFVNESGELDNTIRYTLGEGESATSPTSITFDNQKHLPSALVLRAEKALSSANGGTPTLRNNQFQFKLTSTGENRDSRIPETGITASNNGAGEVIFETINYDVDDIGKTYQYTVEEMLPEGAKQQQDGKWVYQGVTYDSNRFRTITVVVGTDEATGNVKPVMTCDDIGTKVSTDHGEFPKFENTYAAGESFTPSATKTLTGRNMNAGEFKFVLEGEGVRQEAYNEAATDGQPGNIGFTPITYTLSNVRTEPYIYTVREVKPEADPKPGVTYSDVVYTISVKVTDKGDGTLNIEDTYTYTPSTSTEATVAGKVMTFTNKYNATGSATLRGTKMLTGRDMEAREFTFEVYEVINGEESDQPVTTGTNSSATDGNATKINFDPINYTLRNEKGEIIPGVLGDHTYIIKEVPSGKKGVAENNQKFTVVVNVADGQNGQLNTSVKSITGLNSKGEKINQIAFENTYTASANLDLQAVKTINNNGTPGDGEEFTFTLTGGRGEKTENQKKENIGGTITFDTITYDQNDAGGKPFIYEIKESENVPNGYHYDPTVYTVEVTVERDDTAENGLKINKVVKIGTTTPEDQTIKFNNTYPSNGEVQLVAYKDLQGGVIGDGMFSFKLTDSDGNQIGETKPNDGQGKVTFDKIHYTKSDVGQKYTYTITEVKDPNKTGYVTYDTELTRTVTVAVGERDDQVVPTSITYSSGGKYEKDDKANIAIFHNAYKASEILELTATKKLNGRPLTTNDKFNFVVIDKNKETDSVVATAVNNGEEIKFSAIRYNQSQIGQIYEYVIKELELPSTDKSIKCDGRKYNLKVQVTDPNHNGTLVIQVLESDIPTDGMVFTNTYSASGKIGLTGTKILPERDMVAGEFTFNVYEVIDGKESETPASTGTNDEKGNITFTPIKYELSNVGTSDEKDDRRVHEYHVREVKGNRPGITYTDDVCTIKVDVSDGEGNELNAELTSDSEVIEFTNKYTPKEIWISKVDAVSSNELAGASMTIASDGKVLDSWTSGSEKHVFKADYDKTYTLTETAAPKGYLIADSITFKIDETGQLLIKQADGSFVQQPDSVVTMVDAAAPTQTSTPTPGATSTPSTTPGTTSTPSTTETPAPTATPGTTPEATATPTVTPGTTPAPEETPTPEITPAPEDTPNPVVTPRNNPAPTPRGQVLGARKVRVGGTRAAVLGARRGADFAVLGKRRRPATGDSMALLIWIITMSVAMGGAVTSSVMLSLENGRKRRRRK